MKTTMRWALPAKLLLESIAIMRPHGISGNEGLALWFGIPSSGHTTITHIVDIYGSGFQTTPLHMSISLRAMASLTDLSEKIGASLVGQIHSHPGLFLDLSSLDREHGIRSQNYLSVVCPYYAQRQIEHFDECGVHVFEGHKYRRLLNDEVTSRLMVSQLDVEIIKYEVPA